MVDLVIMNEDGDGSNGFGLCFISELEWIGDNRYEICWCGLVFGFVISIVGMKW